MSLADATASFNGQRFTDPGGAGGFSAQTLPYNDSTRSGGSTHRRVMETAPSTLVPEVVKDEATSGIFIRSAPAADYFRDSIIRRKWVLILTDGLYSLSSIAGILTGVPPTTVYGASQYARRVALAEQSDFLGGYQLFLPSSALVEAGDLLWRGSSYFRAVEASYVDPIGVTTVDCFKLQDPIQTLSITVKGAYDPVTESAPTSTVSVSCVVEPREKSFSHFRQDFEDQKPGDKTIYTVVACAAGDVVGPYKVISVVEVGGVYALHCRRDG